jgi:putative SOS response-associated peptidase YedK
MCGRFASDLPPELIRRLFGTMGAIPNDAPSYNIAPTQSTAVVRRHPETGERHLDLLRWGLIPHWSKDKGRQPINARAETVASSGMFRGALAGRRCIVPMSAFYEWDQATTPKQPYAFARRDDTPLALAGLWEGWRDPAGEVVRSFTIITTGANDTLAPIHDRMPVVLEQDDWASWLDTGPVSLLRPAGDVVLRRWKVGSRVNSPRNNDPTLLDPVEQAASNDEQEAGPDSA